MRRVKETFVKRIKTSEGIVVNYETDYEHGNKKVLLLVHGLGGDLTAWDSERIILKDLGYRTIAVDLRGHGFSDHPRNAESYELSRIASDVYEVIKAEKVEELVLVGHCYGGMVVLALEDLYPNVSKALILIDTSYKAPIFLKHKTLRKVLKSCLALLATIFPDAKFREYKDYSHVTYTKDWDILGIIRNMFYTSIRRFIFSFDNVLTLDYARILKKINVPTLVVTGSNDTIYRPKIASEIHHRIKNSILEVIEGGNHVVVLNNPAELTTDINQFLKKIKFLPEK